MRAAGQLPDREIRDRAISGDAPGQGHGPGEAARFRYQPQLDLPTQEMA